MKKKKVPEGWKWTMKPTGMPLLVADQKTKKGRELRKMAKRIMSE